MIELMVVLAMIAILLAIAVPSFVGLTQTNRVTTEANNFATDLQFARAEAIKRGQPVTVCASSGTQCSGASGASQWAAGWIVFLDVNQDQTVDTASGDVVLRVQNKWTSTDTFTASNSVSAITYSRDGFALSLPTQLVMTIHTSPVNASATRCVAVSNTGRQQVQTPSANPSCT